MKSRRHPMFWAVTASRYALTVAIFDTKRGDRYYLPELKREGTLGVDLFERQTDALRAATKNLERLAAEAGIPQQEMAVRLRDGFEARGVKP